MINKAIRLILILLFIFTPIAFGSMELWAFSLMELGILLIIILWALQNLVRSSEFGIQNLKSPRRNPQPAILILLSLFLILILFQLIPIPAEVMKIISPKTYELRHTLAVTPSQSAIRNPYSTVSFLPFVTKVEFFKWLALSGFFLFLLFWRFPGEGSQEMNHFVIVVFLMGIFESLYGMFRFFSGQQALSPNEISSVTGTFINRNYFAGYLLMVIPLSMGFLLSRKSTRRIRIMDWRQKLFTLDGKTILIAFGVMVTILGLLLSASRMGILSLLLSFTLISLFFKDPYGEKRFSKTSVLILSLAILWGVWIGLDTVIGRFFNVSEDFKWRWMLWGNTAEIIRDFPVLGSGLGTFGQIFTMYRSFHIRNLVTHAENDFLQLASEVGLIGIGILFVLFVLLFFKAISGIRSFSDSESQRYIKIGGLVGILALMFHSLVERNLQIPSNAFLYTFLWALVLKPAILRPDGKTERGD
jgi:O-antigen ligase